MPAGLSSATGGRAGERGFTLLEVMVGMILLASIVVIMTQGFMTAMSRADETGDHSVGAAWTQAMLDYLRNQGYGITGSWTETAVTCTTPEPCLPTGFTQATIAVTNAATPGLKQIDVTLYRLGSTSPFLAVSTYAAD
ncbi:MAG: type II secretion system protein, partial [Armatimonadota bacterium]